MPDPQHQHVAAVGQDRVARDITGGAEADDDLPDVGVLGWPPELGKILQPVQRGEDAAQGALRGFADC